MCVLNAHLFNIAGNNSPEVGSFLYQQCSQKRGEAKGTGSSPGKLSWKRTDGYNESKTNCYECVIFEDFVVVNLSEAQFALCALSLASPLVFHIILLECYKYFSVDAIFLSHNVLLSALVFKVLLVLSRLFINPFAVILLCYIEDMEKLMLLSIFLE